jgi:hypothetical protein
MANIDQTEPHFKQLLEKLKKKIRTYSHWPDSRKLGDKLLPFTESEEFVFFLADIFANNRWDAHPELCGKDQYVSYCTFIQIFIQYVVRQKEKYKAIISVLEYAADKAIEVVMKDEVDNKYYMLRCIFNMYKKEKYFPVELLKRFYAVPDDKLMFKPIDGNNAYEAGAYSLFTCGAIKIPSTHNGKPVKKIAYSGFKNTGLTSVEIPEGIEAVGGFAFANTNLKTILLPRSLKSIGEYAFYGCNKLQGDIIIPKNIEKMEQNVFGLSKKISNIMVEGYGEKPDGWDDSWNTIFNWKHDLTFHNVIWDYSQFNSF